MNGHEPAQFGPYQFDASRKEQAMDEFEETWADYTSPTAAAIAVARTRGIGKTTLVDWLRAEDRWPTQRTAAYEREIARLRKRIVELGGDPG